MGYFYFIINCSKKTDIPQSLLSAKRDEKCIFANTERNSIGTFGEFKMELGVLRKIRTELSSPTLDFLLHLLSNLMNYLWW